MSAAIRHFAASDLPRLALQPSQHMCLGIHRPVHTVEDGEELAALGPAWTAVAGPHDKDGGRVLACYGFGYLFPPSAKTGGHALAWAMLAADLGPAHMAITRFARETIAASPIDRIEAIVRADIEAEWRWAELVGFTQVAELRRWGPEGETHLLYERVRDQLNDLTPVVKSEPRLEALGAH